MTSFDDIPDVTTMTDAELAEALAETTMIPCRRCRGTGRHIVQVAPPAKYGSRPEPVPDSPSSYGGRCIACDGAGTLPQPTQRARMVALDAKFAGRLTPR